MRIGRERKALIAELKKHVNRIKGLLFSIGVRGYEPTRRDRRERLDELRTGDGRPLPAHLKAQLTRELDRFELVNEQIKAVETECDAQCAKVEGPALQTMLKAIRGIGAEFANILVGEGLFRQFDNRRQIAAYAGLAPSPWRSSSIDREQGVSKAGKAFQVFQTEGDQFRAAAEGSAEWAGKHTVGPAVVGVEEGVRSRRQRFSD
jgi:transposase